MLTALDDVLRPLVAEGFVAIMGPRTGARACAAPGGIGGPSPPPIFNGGDAMSLNGIGASRSTTASGLTPGYRDAIAGLQSFGELSRTLAQHRDAVLRNVASAAAYPQPSYASPTAAGTALGAAVAAFVGSESGRAAIERAVSAAGTFVKGLLADRGPTQLPLPLE
jgi:hypothetical protein